MSLPDLAQVEFVEAVEPRAHTSSVSQKLIRAREPHYYAKVGGPVHKKEIRLTKEEHDRLKAAKEDDGA